MSQPVTRATPDLPGPGRSVGTATHVTLDAVAREAGVSPATASRALNGTARVRDDLRKRVHAAADRLGYIPNAHAQAPAGCSQQPYSGRDLS